MSIKSLEFFDLLPNFFTPDARMFPGILIPDTSGINFTSPLAPASGHCAMDICTEETKPRQQHSSSINRTLFSSRGHSPFPTLVTLQVQLPICHNSFRARRQTNHNMARNPPKTYNSTLLHTRPRRFLATPPLHKHHMDMEGLLARRAMDLEASTQALVRR